MLYVEALHRGFAAAGRPCHVANMSALLANPHALPQDDAPLVVLGYMKQFYPCLRLDDAGRLHLLGRQVHGVVNDRFMLNIVQQFESTVNLEELATFNRWACLPAWGGLTARCVGFARLMWLPASRVWASAAVAVAARIQQAGDGSCWLC